MPTSRSNKRIIAITMGDPGGIGPEVTLKALSNPALKKHIQKSRKKVFFLLLGNPEIYEENKRRTRASIGLNTISCIEEVKLSTKKANILDLGDDPSEVKIGKISLANAALSYHALEVGAYLALHGIADALVTAPINKEAVQLISPSFTGHTEYLARIAKVKRFGMLLIGGPLRVALVTTHLPLVKVSSALSVENIFSKIEMINDFLKKKLKVRKPRVGVAALNPHAGEGGKMGNEEAKYIIPAVKKAKRKGLYVVGPLPADVIFHQALNGKFDAVVAMYHDQGLGPLKMLAFETGVNITLNLPFVRTSPDHGTAFDIAYKNKANPDSMIEAIKTAIDLIR